MTHATSDVDRPLAAASVHTIVAGVADQARLQAGEDLDLVLGLCDGCGECG